MRLGRIGGACACIVGAAMVWCASVQARADVATDSTGGPTVQAVEIELHGAGDQGTVTGAPYAAEAVREFVQTLADGNRIVRSSTTAVYRDAAGRTRHEQGGFISDTLGAATEQPKQIMIADPVKGLAYLLDPVARTARRLPVPPFDAALLPGPGGAPLPFPPPTGDMFFFEAAAPPPGGAGVTRMLATRRVAGGTPEVSESLGTQTVEGVLAEGTRSTRTIAAGQVGNERPIEIVSDRWFSPELKALVLSTEIDPRFGETTYRLSNIVRGDPDAALFEIPADYQLIEAGGAGDVIFRRRLP